MRPGARPVRTATDTVRRVPERRASCSCGQLQAVVTGDPVRVSICHCLACQRRTGSSYGYQARFPAQSVTISGRFKQFIRHSDEDAEIRRFNFCPAGDRESVLASVDVGSEPAGNPSARPRVSRALTTRMAALPADDGRAGAMGRRWKARAHGLDARGVRRVRPRARPRQAHRAAPDAGCERKDDIGLALLLSSSVS